MPAKGQRTKPVNEQILVEAARIYDNKELRDEDDEVVRMKGTDLNSYAKFLSKEDAFTKVITGCGARPRRRARLREASSLTPPAPSVLAAIAKGHPGAVQDHASTAGQDHVPAHREPLCGQVVVCELVRCFPRCAAARPPPCSAWLFQRSSTLCEAGI
jgi:hypothetical protein